MKKPNTYTLRIVGSKPSKLTLERLAIYLAEMAKLLGEKDNIHFDKLTTGSACLKVWAEPTVASDVYKRIALATNRSDSASKEALSALDRINQLLAQDGTKGELKNPNGVVIYPFPGAKIEKPEQELVADQDSTITGQVIKIGGRDDSIPLLVRDSDGREYNCTVIGAQLAKEISAHYLGDVIELSGKARWKRSPAGIWELVHMNIKSWSLLVDDWDAAFESMEVLAKGWRDVPDVENYLSGLRKGH
ncbi:hypothetical protein [Pseudomonas frederiksbergensis]|uniref:hypothetical protein n=1 Tax=Pseudomonas frederiksbergensis TaxID=104087 RepID=UPI003D2116E1